MGDGGKGQMWSKGKTLCCGGTVDPKEPESKVREPLPETDHFAGVKTHGRSKRKSKKNAELVKKKEEN